MPIKPDRPIEQILGRELSALSKKNLEHYINRAFQYWREKGFPYKTMAPNEVFTDYKKVENILSKTVLTRKQIRSSNIGLGLVNSFHPQMWQVVCHGHTKAPIDHFNDDATLRKLLEKVIAIWPDCSCWRAYRLRSMLCVYSGGRVSNFRPTASKAIIDKFSKRGDLVLDFCAGYGGRFLGAVSMDRHYVGVDASTTQISANRQLHTAIMEYAKGTAEFHHSCAEDFLPTMSSKSFDLIFTSPPYFKQEKYATCDTQSFRRYGSYGAWKANFLQHVIHQSHRLIKRGGFFVINIANIRGYSVSEDFLDMVKPYFRRVDTYDLHLGARPVQRQQGTFIKAEPIFIFKKK
jgi:16S rRNA G966 N2-methylase RsmD